MNQTVRTIGLRFVGRCVYVHNVHMGLRHGGQVTTQSRTISSGSINDRLLQISHNHGNHADSTTGSHGQSDMDTGTLDVSDVSEHIPDHQRQSGYQHPDSSWGTNILGDKLPQNTLQQTKIDGDVKNVSALSDTLYQELKTMNSEDVLDTFYVNHASMDKLHYAICLKRLFTIQSYLRGESKVEFIQNLQQDNRFQVLCASVTRRGRYYSAALTFDIFRFLRTFGFGERHPATQSYLQLLKHHLNDLHLDQLISLAHMTQQIDNNKNTELITEGIQALVPHRMSEMMGLSLFQSIVLLNMFGTSLKVRWQKLVLSQIEKYVEDDYLTSYSARLLLRALGRVNIRKDELEQICVIAIEKHLPKYNKSDLKYIVQSLVSLNLYCPDLLNDIGDLFIEHSDLAADRSHEDEEHRTDIFKDKLNLLCIFSQQSHVHVKLLEDTVPDILDRENIPMEEWMTVISLVSSANTMNMMEGIQRFTTQLTQETWENQTDNHNLEAVVSFCSNLLIVGVDPPPGMVERICTPQSSVTQGDISTSFTPQGHGGYSLLMSEAMAVLQCHVSTPVHSEADGKWSSQRQVSPGTCNHGNLCVSTPGLDTALRLGVQDTEVSAGCELSPGLCVDFLLKSSVDEQRLAVKVMPSSAFNRNLQNLKGLPLLYVTALVKLGCKVFVINPQTWRNIPERERHVFVRHRIRKLMEDQTAEYFIM